jgi:bla regulator protein BlaR1
MNPGYVSAIANHLWQSTLFAGLAALLTLALRNNHARVRHGVWLAASCKFLIPISVLIAWGGHVRWRSATETTQSNIAIMVDEVSQPFPTPAISPRRVAPPLTASPLPEILLAGWALGFLGLSGAWWIRWRRIRDAVHAGSPLWLEIPIRAVSSPSSLEPGVFGIVRPVLLLPESMFDRLTPPQVEAIIAHELCHVRHRDNLVAALHMFVETVFWFHPLLWWVGKRIVEERERACDEEVLRLGSEPRVYAEGILNVCKLYLEAPLVCVSGITGADLKKRIHQIVSAGAVCQLSWRRKFLLAAAGLAALAWPLAVGIMNAPTGHAQSADSPPLKFEVASVKPNKSGSERSTSWIFPGGRFTATNNTVRALILNAYNQIPPYLLSGGPSWIDSEAYDVEAKPADGAIPPGLRGRPLWDKNRAMLRAMLADRFHLEIRTVSKEMPLYEISVAKNGPKLTKSTYDCSAEIDPCHGFRGNPRRLSAMGVDMADLASILSGYAGRPVLDKTGISGVFDFLLQWNVWYGRQHTAQTTDETSRPPSRYEGEQPDPDSLPDLATALDRQLGLKLESRKGPVDTYVIERVERPSEN